MKTWIMWGMGLEKIEIKANSFDDALQYARKINLKYSTGQLK